MALQQELWGTTVLYAKRIDNQWRYAVVQWRYGSAYLVGMYRDGCKLTVNETVIPNAALKYDVYKYDDSRS